MYRNDPKFSDRQVWATSVDPDQTAPLSGSTLFAIPSETHYFRKLTQQRKIVENW